MLQVLARYYRRKSISSNRTAPRGFEEKEIPFVIVLNEQGKFIHLEDTREDHGKGKKRTGKSFLVPQGQGRSGAKSYTVTNLLWDHYGYVLAYAKEGKDADEIAKNADMANKQHQVFKDNVTALSDLLPTDLGVKATYLFLSDLSEIAKVKDDTSDAWKACQKIKGCNLSFRLVSEPSNLVCQSKAVQAYQIGLSSNESGDQEIDLGLCLISGERRKIARLHTGISGVSGKPSPFASVNLDAFESYHKTQGFNFPISEQAMFEYTTGLNTLLSSNNRFRLGDSSMVCWAEEGSDLEQTIPLMFSGGGKDNPDAEVQAVKSLFASIHNGAYSAPDGKQKFYVLGLAPNVARIVVRFWAHSTIAEMAENIYQYFKDIEMVRGINSPYPEYMSLMKLICHLGFEYKVDNIPPNLLADISYRIMAGLPFPITLLQLALRRNKAEQKVNYQRASIIKAYLNRAIRAGSLSCKEVSMSLDISRTDSGYVLGRLFAVLEKIQEDANPGLNATIRDRYFGAAASTPITVFPTLIKLSMHHLSKMGKEFDKQSWKINSEKNMNEVIDKIQNLPTHLNLEQQGLFAIGYYHQRQYLFTKKDKEIKSDK